MLECFGSGGIFSEVMDALESKIAALVEPVAMDMGLELVRVKIFGDRRKTVQIMAEHEDGAMDVADCASLSRAMSAVFEAEDPIAGEWVLEVSSPGIDRPLTRAKDFETYAGYEVKIELTQMMGDRRRHRGCLVGLEGEDVLIELEGEDAPRRLPFNLIQEAKLVLTDDLVKTSLAKNGDDVAVMKKEEA